MDVKLCKAAVISNIDIDNTVFNDKSDIMKL